MKPLDLNNKITCSQMISLTPSYFTELHCHLGDAVAARFSQKGPSLAPLSDEHFIKGIFHPNTGDHSTRRDFD